MSTSIRKGEKGGRNNHPLSIKCICNNKEYFIPIGEGVVKKKSAILMQHCHNKLIMFEKCYKMYNHTLIDVTIYE